MTQSDYLSAAAESASLARMIARRMILIASFPVLSLLGAEATTNAPFSIREVGGVSWLVKPNGERFFRLGFASSTKAGSPKAAPRSVPAGQRLVGGIGVSFADSHVEMVRLENLWQLYWHNNYQPPALRPP